MSVVIHVFEPSMCCSTGDCGPVVDPDRARFATDVEWLETHGVSVERYDLGRQPSAFAQDPVVSEALETKGEAGLPLLKVNGVVKSTGVYPSRKELADWAGVADAAG